MADFALMAAPPEHPAHPSGCYLCRTSDARTGERYIDTGITIDYEGALAICETCAAEMADKLGWISPQRAAALDARISDLASDVARLSKAVEDATSALVQQVIDLVRPFFEDRRPANPTSAARSKAAK